MKYNWDSMFENSSIKFSVLSEPVSLQNKESKKKLLREKIQEITKECPEIITGHCWIHIDYFCKNIKRLKNPSAYDMDNLIKPILDSLCGYDGILIDDSLVDRVEINWIDKNGNDEFEISIEHSFLFSCEKKSLYFYKHGNWCFPTELPNLESKEAIISIFAIWDLIKTEEDYQKFWGMLPQHNFLPYNKICKSGFRFVEI